MFKTDNPDQHRVIIEDTFFGRNVHTLKLISRIGMIAYITARQQGITDMTFIYATTARKALGLKGNAKKQEVHQQFARITGIKLEDEDMVDAIVLCLNGLIQQRGLQ
jgi:Holliday junction resolvasome RuvABC endonuclease subunit